MFLSSQARGVGEDSRTVHCDRFALALDKKFWLYGKWFWPKLLLELQVVVGSVSRYFTYRERSPNVDLLLYPFYVLEIKPQKYPLSQIVANNKDISPFRDKNRPNNA